MPKKNISTDNLIVEYKGKLYPAQNVLDAMSYCFTSATSVKKIFEQIDTHMEPIWSKAIHQALLNKEAILNIKKVANNKNIISFAVKLTPEDIKQIAKLSNVPEQLVNEYYQLSIPSQLYTMIEQYNNI